MSDNDSGSGKGRFSLLAILFHPALKIAGGLFSLLALLFGGLTFSKRRKKKKTGVTESRVAASILMTSLQDVRHELGAFRVWLDKQTPDSVDMDELRTWRDNLRSMYNTWVSHTRMEEILSTVEYDPKIGVNVSNGLHELRSVNILLQGLFSHERPEDTESYGKLVIVGEHLGRAIGFFGYINKDIENRPENRQVDSLKEKTE